MALVFKEKRGVPLRRIDGAVFKKKQVVSIDGAGFQRKAWCAFTSNRWRCV
jgi:hypothetical protein